MKDHLIIKLLSGVLISLICIIVTMILTTGCKSDDETYCDPGYKYLKKYSVEKTCANACPAGKIYVYYDDETCCCEK